MVAIRLGRSTLAGLSLIVLLAMVSGCATASFNISPTISPPTVQPKASQTLLPINTQTRAPTFILRATATKLPFQVCSPLQGITLAELGDILTTPFDPPAPGLDDGHHGADFAFYSRGDLHQMTGLPIQSVMTGVIAGIGRDRPPYGNLLIVETPLDDLPVAWVAALNLPQPGPTPPPNPRLQCPAGATDVIPAAGKSIYTLYAHLNQVPTQSLGEVVSCGQPIGEVGNSGASGNPHLHIEVRLGPAGTQWDEMAHYTNSATDEEMRNYCQWRISGQFQMIDPMVVLSTSP